MVGKSARMSRMGRAWIRKFQVSKSVLFKVMLRGWMRCARNTAIIQSMEDVGGRGAEVGEALVTATRLLTQLIVRAATVSLIGTVIKELSESRGIFIRTVVGSERPDGSQRGG